MKGGERRDGSERENGQGSAFSSPIRRTQAEPECAFRVTAKV